MIIYSKKIIQFINDTKQFIRNVIAHEVRFKVRGDRFDDRLGLYSYPIKLVIFNNRSMLGYFDPNFYEMGFHECLMHVSREKRDQIIRHEIAHYICFIQYGANVQPHGSEFKAFCLSLGWGAEVYGAKTCLEGAQEAAGEENIVLRKVQKLMALSTSSNQYEAEQAMLKSQELLMKHNIESKYVGGNDDGKVVLKRILQYKKSNAKLDAIGRMLDTFFVTLIYKGGKEYSFVEIMGTQVNVEIAEYVSNFLNNELEVLWEHAQKTFGIRGLAARNSFYSGLARGYCQKVNALKKGYNSETSRALMVIEKQLADAKEMVYPKLKKAKRSASHCCQSFALGERIGNQLNINTAVGDSSKSFPALLPSA